MARRTQKQIEQDYREIREAAITFAHYKMCSLKSANNCTLMFSRRVYDYSNSLTDIKNKSYRSFLMDFAKRHDLL